MHREEERQRELNRLLHDLKLPITVLQSLSDIMHKLNKQDELEEYLLMLDRNTRYITRIATSLKDTIAKIDDEEHNIASSDIVGYTENIVESIRAVCEIRNINLIFECSEEYAECNLNWRNYERILLNVLQNSIKHAIDCTEIKLLLKVTEEKIAVRIWDDGKNSLHNGVVKTAENSSGEGLFIITTLAKKLNATVEHTFDSCGMYFLLEIPNDDIIVLLES